MLRSANENTLLNSIIILVTDFEQHGYLHQSAAWRHQFYIFHCTSKWLPPNICPTSFEGLYLVWFIKLLLPLQLLRDVFKCPYYASKNKTLHSLTTSNETLKCSKILQIPSRESMHVYSFSNCSISVCTLIHEVYVSNFHIGVNQQFLRFHETWGTQM